MIKATEEKFAAMLKEKGVKKVDTDKIYDNKDKKCECWKCEKEGTCPYEDKYQRLPRTEPGALGLCPKLQGR